MISVTRERRMPYALDSVWAFLSEPANLPLVMARIIRVEVGTKSGDNTPLTAHFDFGTTMGRRAATGVFRTVAQDEVHFEAARPLPLLARWTLQPEEDSVLLIALLRFDLKPMLGPLAMLAPIPKIKARVADELTLALKRTEELLNSSDPKTI
ncbi:MAG: SRPBCC family protein [Herpetosiphonaceae bacterium]|nr:SRPBCC family protein [Herpetosiphonaceae bacterium]